MKKFTYNSLKNLDSRQEMLRSDISSLGWQSGGFGDFNEQARVVTISAAEQIKSEIEIYIMSIKCGQCVDFDIECPTLSKLLS